MTVQPPLPPPPSTYAPQYGAPPPSGGRYAGFWIRLLAYIIDRSSSAPSPSASSRPRV